MLKLETLLENYSPLIIIDQNIVKTGEFVVIRRTGPHGHQGKDHGYRNGFKYLPVNEN